MYSINPYLAYLFLTLSNVLALLFAFSSFNGLELYAPDLSLSLWLFRGWIFILILLLSMSSFFLKKRYKATVVLALVLPVSLFTIGYFSNDHFLFKPSTEATLMSVDELENADIRDDLQLTVLQSETEAIAFLIRYFAPEAVNIEIGGRQVTYTYCGLSNLAVALQRNTSSTFNKPLNVGVFSQQANNLVLYNIETEATVQQINSAGDLESQIQEYPGFRMSYGNFKKAFPDGKIYFTQPGNISWWEEKYNLIRIAILRSRIREHNSATSEDFAFPLEISDHRLHPKTPVYGLSIGTKHVAFTKAHIIDQGGRIDTLINGRYIAVVYHNELDTVAAYYALTDNKHIDVYGNSEGRKLNRVESFKPAVLWGVWQHFYDGELNGVPKSESAG